MLPTFVSYDWFLAPTVPTRSMELDKASVISLIQNYQAHRVLWDPKNEWHFNKVKKKLAWQQVADSVGVSVEDAKKKMASLLGSFRREKAKGLKLTGAGKGTSKVYKSDWFAFKSFAFLFDKDEDWVDSEEMEDSFIKTENASGDSECSTTYDQNVENSITIQNDEAFMKPSNPRKRAKDNDSRQEDARIGKTLKMFQQSTELEDATKKYTDYLAEKLNQFDPMTKSILIHKFNNLIFEAEMNMYSEYVTPDYVMQSPSSPSSTSSLPSPQPLTPSISLSPTNT